MAACVMPFHHEDAAATGPTRGELGIPEDAVVFGELVSTAKLSRRCLDSWREILLAVPNAVLLFSPSRATDRGAFQHLMAAMDIPTERVFFVPSSDKLPEARARYRLVDIVLDTFPYSGGDTTMAALDMAKPVVTLLGARQSERMTASILTHAGLGQLVASDVAGYVSSACRLARDPGERMRLGQDIPALLRASGMADMGKYTRAFEAALCEAVRMVNEHAEAVDDAER
jgi:predicted O-linked N-acetylglucosamine transferase (SPINDLY family)